MRKVMIFGLIMVGCLMANTVRAQEISGLAQQQSVLVNVFEQVRALPDFGYIDEVDNGNVGFTDAVGNGVLTGYGNAKPREQVEQILSTIPEEYHLFEARNERDKIRSLYLDKSDASHPILMFFIAGTGSNDTVLILWRNGDLTKIEQEAVTYESDLEREGYKIKK